MKRIVVWTIAAFGLASASLADEPIAPQVILGRALAVARAIDDPENRTRSLQYVAEGWEGSGDRAPAKTTLREAFTAAMEIADNTAVSRNLRLDHIARAQIEIGDIEGAQASARQIEDILDRVRALLAIARAQAAAGDRSVADATIREALAGASSDAGRARPQALEEIAVVQADFGDIDGGLATAKMIEDAETRSEALSGISGAQADAGDFAGSLATAKSTGNPFLLVEALNRIAAARADAGDRAAAAPAHEEALATAQASQDHSERQRLLRRVAMGQIETGDLDGALATIGLIEQGPDRDDVLGEIAAARAEAGDASGALEAATAIVDPEDRAKALGLIGAAQVRSGDRSAAETTLQAALEAVEQVVDVDDRAIAMAMVAVARTGSRGDICFIFCPDYADDFFAALGSALKTLGGASATAPTVGSSLNAADLDAGLAMVRIVDDPLERLVALAMIGHPLIVAGDGDALRLVVREAEAILPAFERSVSGDELRIRIVRLGVVAVQVVANDIDRAAALAAATEDAELRAALLAFLGWTQVRIGERAAADSSLSAALDALETAGDLENPGALKWIAAAQIEMGDQAAAFQTIDRIADDVERVRSLVDIAGKPFFR